MAWVRRHPDARGLMASILANLDDPLPRLVFADWLDETGDPADAAWASYIRDMQTLAELKPGDFQEALFVQIHETVPRIRASLTVSAARFVRDPFGFEKLIPCSRIAVRLARFEVPRETFEYVPHSVAQENCLFPITQIDERWWIAANEPMNEALHSKIELILNRVVIFVRAGQRSLIAAIDRHYGRNEYEIV